MNTNNNTNNTMSINNTIINTLYNKKGNGFVGIVYVADVRMNKRGNPLADHNVVKCVKTQFNFGIVYENAVANRASKEQGGGKVEFVAEKAKGYEWECYPYLLRAVKTNELQVRFYCKDGAKTEVVYFVDGHFATDSEIAIIKEFAQTSSWSVKQAEAGCTENQVRPRNIRLKNIIKLAMDGEVYVNTELISVAQTAKMEVGE